MKRDATRTVVYEFSYDEVVQALCDTFKLENDLKYDPKLLIAAKKKVPRRSLIPLFEDGRPLLKFRGLSVRVTWEDQ